MPFNAEHEAAEGAGMTQLLAMKRYVAGRLEYRTLKKHRSRLGRRVAPRYTEYLQHCRSRFRGMHAVAPEVAGAVEEFERKGYAAFWTDDSRRLATAMFDVIREEESRGLAIWDAASRYRSEIYTRFPQIEELLLGVLGSFLTAVYRASFKIFFGILYKSERAMEAPIGSQLWHTDGGPGTCINVMLYLKDVAREDGAMECLPWAASVAIYRKELLSAEVQRRLRSAAADGAAERDVKCRFYLDEIERSYRDRVEQPTGPAGLLLPFRNNILHKGGFPEPGRTRYVCVFHCYPSDRLTQFERYRQLGIPKTASYPKDPAADF